MDDPFKLSYKTILVTGASSGIGRSVAVICSEQGAKLCLTARSLLRLEETRSMLTPGDHCILIADLVNETDIVKLADQLPELDGLVLNAGMVKTMPIQYVKNEIITKIFAVNVQSSILLIQQLLKKKKIRNDGSICFISSISSDYAQFGNSLYSSTKGAINSFSRALALELAPKKIRVNAVLPSFVETEILKDSPINEEQLIEHMKNFPLGRFGKPEDIAYLSVYLLSDASKWMTGSLLTIDGGYSLK